MRFDGQLTKLPIHFWISSAKTQIEGHHAVKQGAAAAAAREQAPGCNRGRVRGITAASYSQCRHYFMYNESLELTAPQHTAVKT
jgi:hypothetical protein